MTDAELDEMKADWSSIFAREEDVDVMTAHRFVAQLLHEVTRARKEIVRLEEEAADERDRYDYPFEYD